ncbi:MAG: T9SS type A sorting domain-containing protein [Bacteroidales bacterium]
MKILKATYLLLVSLITLNSSAQEVATGLLSNRQLGGSALPRSLLKAGTAEEPLIIPFSDDFSDVALYPSTARWSDIQVYINNTFSVMQPSAGIATFDCLDQNGHLYDVASQAVFEADHLTSRAIDLAFLPADSIFLSFLYEAGGISDLPEAGDSLTLSFWAPAEEKWYSIWQVAGEATDGFRRVILPITDTRFLMTGFRFMFTGYASLAGVTSEPSQAGNADLWNIDHILLDKGRSVHDTVIHDVAMTLPVRSLVKEYEAMPWRHFRQAYLSAMSPAASINYRNNDTIVRNVTRQVTIRDMSNGAVVREFNAGASNAAPLTDVLYEAPLLYTYNTASSPDTAQFMVTLSLITDDFDPKQNDTLKYIQRFSDYFAIDDGTAEAGYGINGQGSRNAMAALRFRSFLPDSVTGISICFNDAYENANRQGFEIMVWADDNGRPGVLLGSTDSQVASQGTGINGFQTYSFEKPVRVTDAFWIGWRQETEAFLNAGLDLNTPNDGRQYFSLSGSWQQSQVPGTVMMRPVMKGSGAPTSADNGTLINELFSLYPNPTHGYVTIVPSEDAPDEYVIDVISVTGSLVMTFDRTENPDLSRLAAGSYMLLVKTSDGRPLSLLRVIKVN